MYFIDQNISRLLRLPIIEPDMVTIPAIPDGAAAVKPMPKGQKSKKILALDSKNAIKNLNVSSIGMYASSFFSLSIKPVIRGICLPVTINVLSYHGIRRFYIHIYEKRVATGNDSKILGDYYIPTKNSGKNKGIV